MNTKTALLAAALALFLAGCVNDMRISEGSKFKNPDGSETHVTLYRDDANPLSDQVIVAVVKECHKGDGPHRILPGTKKHDGKYHCGPSKTTVGIIPGIVRSIVSLGGFFTRHSGKAYSEGSITETNVSDTVSATSDSDASARSGRGGKKKPPVNKK